jgi:hypothetical protein
MRFFYGEELLAPRPTPKLEGHPLSAVRDCLFNIFAANLHTGGRSSIRNLKTRHALMTGTKLSRHLVTFFPLCCYAFFQNSYNCALKQHQPCVILFEK